MKITIVGGAGARVPLVTNGLLRFREELKTEELSLWDIDETKRQTVAHISRAMVGRFGATLKISTPATLEEALSGASFVITSIRVGGTQGRITDETVALSHQTLGQETVGAGGFALALRTLPVMLQYARKVSQLASDAWLVNFSNPVGIVSQALIAAGLGERSIGVCDTPREQFERLSSALAVPLQEASFDYLGLNHLGWIRRILVAGRDRMPELLQSAERLREVYRIPFFEPDFLQNLGLFPTEYLYFYYRPERARRQTLASGRTRGQQVRDLEEELMSTVQQAGGKLEEVLASYDRYLASRNATYMTVETGRPVEEERVVEAREELYQSAAGYERIAIDVMRAIESNQPAVIPVDTANHGAIADFELEDAVEVPCVLNGNGVHPLAAGQLPEPVRELALRVKEYERLSVQAVLSRSRRIAEDALSRNPILQSRDQARAILGDYLEAHSPYLDYLV
ncbi:MAG: 6-phospho-beta-glucosidase [Acidobacteriota bacterium]